MEMQVRGHTGGQSVLYCTSREQMFFKSLIENMVNIKDHSTEEVRKLKLPKNKMWLNCHHITEKPG